jgi:hypothetical protein
LHGAQGEASPRAALSARVLLLSGPPTAGRRLDGLHFRPPTVQAADQGVVTKFHALRPPSISIRDYLERCVRRESRAMTPTARGRGDACAR